MKLVLDASVALAWLFGRSSKKEAVCAEQALSEIANCETFVPSLWHTEIANVLIVSERRRVISEAQIIDYLNRLSQLPITMDIVSPADSRNAVISLAREYGLTAYDATYLEMALRMNAAIATFDEKLAAAMQKAGGVVYGE